MHQVLCPLTLADFVTHCSVPIALVYRFNSLGHMLRKLNGEQLRSKRVESFSDRFHRELYRWAGRGSLWAWFYVPHVMEKYTL